MNWEFLINEFAYIAKNMSISAAARELATTQSALSKRLDAAERELGCVLIERKKGAMKCSAITEAGQILLDAACTMGHTYAAAVAAIERTQTTNAKVIAGGSSIKYSLRAPMARLADRLTVASDLVLRFRDELPDIPFEMLRAGTLDFVVEPYSWKADTHALASVPIGRIDAVLVVHEKSLLAKQATVQIADLSGMGIITRASQADYSLRKHLHALWEDRGMAPFFLVKGGESLSAVALTHLNPTNALIVPTTYKSYLEATVPFARFIPLADEGSAFDIRLFYRDERNQDLDTLIATLHEISPLM